MITQPRQAAATLLLLSFVWVGTEGFAYSAAGDYRSCDKADLIGCWEKVDIKSTLPPIPKEPLFAQYQFYAFQNDGTAAFLHSDKPITELADLLSAHASAKFDVKNGHFQIQYPEWSRSQRCSVTRKPDIL